MGMRSLGARKRNDVKRANAQSIRNSGSIDSLRTTRRNVVFDNRSSPIANTHLDQFACLAEKPDFTGDFVVRYIHQNNLALPAGAVSKLWDDDRLIPDFADICDRYRTNQRLI